MEFFIDGIISALHLIFSGDAELLDIVGVSLFVSGFSTLTACIFGVPTGFFLSMASFRGKHFVITILQTLLALPTVVVGLFVYAFLTRKGLFGPFDLLYTKAAIIIGQTILILPVVIVFTLAAVSRAGRKYRKTAMTLGANKVQAALVIFREVRFGILAAVIAAFGRVIAEVGISMMLGGNINGFTRTMTTAMALEYDKGQFVLAIALGIVLLAIAFSVNFMLRFFQGREG